MEDSIHINTLPIGLFHIDKAMRVKSWNQVLEKQTGFSFDEVKNKYISELQFFHAKNQKFLNLKDCLPAKGKKNFQKTVLIKAKDEGMKMCFMSIRHISDESLQHIVSITDISEETRCSDGTPDTNHTSRGIVGSNRYINELHKMIDYAADSSANVMITGESGTGKELVAKAIHNSSDRKNHPLITVNCSALPETLLESELFGHSKGSFTGAFKDKPGKFEAAHKGTIFLDEIGEISQMMQVKLLRTIQEKKIMRVGENKEIQVDIRIIAATNKNLRKMVIENTFREDLFYRLNVFPIHTMPLREQKNDIPLLCEHFIKKYNRINHKDIKGLSHDALRILMDYCWPGNIRELENSIEHAFVLCDSHYIDVFDLPQEIRLVTLRKGLCKNIDQTNEPAYFFNSISQIENEMHDAAAQNQKTGNQLKISKQQLAQKLKENNWNRTKTAKELGISRVALWKKIKKFQIEEKEK